MLPDDAFYGETQEWIEKLSALGCLNVEMEKLCPQYRMPQMQKESCHDQRRIRQPDYRGSDL